MATKVETVENLCGMLAGRWDVRYKKMFGEYMVYVNEKPVLIVCNDTVFIKMLPRLSELLKDAALGVPYHGAKDHYVLDLCDPELCVKAVEIAEPLTQLSKKRKK